MQDRILIMDDGVDPYVVDEDPLGEAYAYVPASAYLEALCLLSVARDYVADFAPSDNYEEWWQEPPLRDTEKLLEVIDKKLAGK